MNFLIIKNIKIHILLKNSIFFFGVILVILWIFLQNFIKKYEFYIWVYLNEGLKMKMENF